MTYKIILIKIDHRSQEAELVQKVLTEYGCNIKVRLGLHEVSAEKCAQDGMIILHVEGKPKELNELVEKLNQLNYVKAQLLKM
ncbi:MAG TPA: hypothetical protein PLF50_00250 [Candidatus Cloacimonadota bacterium]|nr:hypothetical protein [Candidatus Cloacimonadota bacterium]HOV15928.1 hypothetical protein [Candidatus Cloacimonadota bacterium]HQL14277.1 hypothetical protein [Candidatus Cloacimonadota bacterium]